MDFSYSDFRRFDDKLDRLLAQNVKILHNQRLTLLQGMIMDAQLTQTLEDIAALKAYVVAVAANTAARDAEDVRQNAAIAELTAQHAADVAAGTAKDDAAATLHSDIAAVMAAADDAKAALPVPTPPVVSEPPVVDPAPVDPAPVADPVVDPNA